MVELFEAVRVLYHRLKLAVQEVHGEGSLSSGRRGILRDLKTEGEKTVPELARLRSVSRQHVQVVVDSLSREGLVELVENPAHKKSRLVRLTPAGERVLSEMGDRERVLLAGLPASVSRSDMVTAQGILERLHEGFQGEQWVALVTARGAGPRGTRTRVRGKGRRKAR